MIFCNKVFIKEIDCKREYSNCFYYNKSNYLVLRCLFDLAKRLEKVIIFKTNKKKKKDNFLKKIKTDSESNLKDLSNLKLEKK